MAARKVVMFVLSAHIYVLSIKLRCGNFNGNDIDIKKNIFNTVRFIDCINLLRCRLYHRREKSIHRTALFLFLLLACGDIGVNPGPGQAEKGFYIYQQNLRGLWNNKEVLENFINQKNVKIFGKTETLLSSSTPNLFLQIRWYTFERKDRIKAGGGIGVYIKEDITYLRRNDLECDEIEAIWPEIMAERGNFFLIRIMYCPPQTHQNTYTKNFEQKLANILNNISLLNKETIILGDLKCNYLDNKSNVSIKDLFNLRGYKQIIKTATRIAKDSSTRIDMILTNRPDNVIIVNSIISSLSDHNVIKCVRKLNNIKFNPRTIKCRDYKNYDQTTVSAELSVVNWDIVYNTPDPDMAWNNLQQILSETINRHAPLINK